MDQGPLFRRWFHEELDALDHFFEEGVREKELSFGTDDPDMRRIVEAMAYFNARTRAAAAASMRGAIVRMAGGLLDDLFAPMPAVAMLRAGAEKLVDGPMELPEGTRFRVEAPDRRASLFVTKEPLTVRPIAIEKAHIARTSRGAELRLELLAAVPQKGQVELPLFVRRHGDHGAAAELKEALDRCFLHATAQKDGGAATRCAVAFTAPAPERPWDQGEDGSPLGRIRSFFHAPEQDLFLRVTVPAEGGAFRKLELTLLLDPDLPEGLTVSQDTFVLFVVPAENAWTDLAEPIAVDGTAEARPIRAAQSALDAVEPVLVRGVYKPVGKVLSPLPPRSLADDGPCYEVLFPEGDAPLVRIACPDAVARPWIASVDAVWSQPALWTNARGPLSVRPQRK
jgi:type VI secretion system protein ImpG